MKFAFFLVIAFVLSVAAIGIHKSKQAPFLDRDVWLTALLKNKIDYSTSAEDLIVSAYQKQINPTDPEWAHSFTSDLAASVAGSFGKSSDYAELAYSLYRARARIRLLKPLEKTREALDLLGALTDETLYAMSVRFPQESKKAGEWRIEFESSDHCEIGKYFGFNLCLGDVVLSKSEAFSSSLFSFRSLHSGTFSHASTPYFTEALKNLLLVEAEPMGGLFEDPNQEGQLPKIGIYRMTSESPEQRIRVDQALKTIVRSRDPRDSFNFTLDPQCASGKYFCTEILYCAYKQSGLDPQFNPYNETLWSPPSPSAQELIEQISSTRKGPIPMPGDVELSEAFRPVGFAIKLDQIPTLRIHAAIVEAFIELMHEDKGLRLRYLEALNYFGDKRLGQITDETSLNFLAHLGLSATDKLSVLRSQLPAETRMKEIAFYFHFQNQMLTNITSNLSGLSSSSRQPLMMGDLKRMATPQLRAGTEAFISLLAPLQNF